MEKLYNFIIILGILLFAEALPAQCTTSKVENTSGTTAASYQLSPGTNEKSFGQSFITPSIPGSFSAVRFWLTDMTPNLDTPSKYSIRIYEGSGNTGTLVVNQPIRVRNADQNLTFILATPFAYNPETTYTAYVHGAGGWSFNMGMRAALSNVFNDGVAWQDNTTLSGLDFNFTVELSNISPPDNLAATRINDTSVNLTWDNQTGSDSYDWVVVNQGGDPDNPLDYVDNGNTTAPNAIAAGLTLNATYDAYVRVNAICNSNLLTSLWSSEFTFIPSNLTVLGINKTDAFETKLYPNPTTDYVKLISNNQNIKQYAIYNILGSKVSEGKLNNNKTINVQNYTNGIYFIRLENGTVFKLIKK